MTGPSGNDDDQLLAQLKDALTSASAVPPGFIEAGRTAYAWRTIDAELAELTYDSAIDDDALSAATRAQPAAVRAMTFTGGQLTIALELTPDAVLGQITPTYPGTVAAYVADREVASAPIDDLGFFAVRPVPATSFRLLVRTASGAVVLTGPVSA